MLELVSNALGNQDYYLCLYDHHLYIYHYLEILSFNPDLIMVKLKDINLKIKGSNLLIKKMHEHELLIEGNLVSVQYE